jgi:hypothetical protein
LLPLAEKEKDLMKDDEDIFFITVCDKKVNFKQERLVR